MSCEPATFQGVTETVMRGIQKDLKKYGFHIPIAPTGMLEGSGVSAEFQWNEDRSELRVHIIRKPFIVSCGFVMEKLRETVISNGGR